jgi:hypothetical protein
MLSTEPLKEEKSEKSPKDVEAKRTPAIMKRLGGYINQPAAKPSKPWAKEQVSLLVLTLIQI